MKQKKKQHPASNITSCLPEAVVVGSVQLVLFWPEAGDRAKRLCRELLERLVPTDGQKERVKRFFGVDP